MSEFIKSKAAIAWGPNQPLSVEEVDVMMPKKGEVMVKLLPQVYAIQMLLLYQVKILKAFSPLF